MLSAHCWASSVSFLDKIFVAGIHLIDGAFQHLACFGVLLQCHEHYSLESYAERVIAHVGVALIVFECLLIVSQSEEAVGFVEESLVVVRIYGYAVFAALYGVVDVVAQKL